MKLKNAMDYDIVHEIINTMFCGTIKKRNSCVDPTERGSLEAEIEIFRDELKLLNSGTEKDFERLSEKAYNVYSPLIKSQNEEAMRYYKSAIGGLDVSVGELLNDPRRCHILIHGSGIFPEYVQDEDAFFDAALQILSEKEKNEKADDNYEAYRRANYRPSEDSDMND